MTNNPAAAGTDVKIADRELHYIRFCLLRPLSPLGPLGTKARSESHHVP